MGYKEVVEASRVLTEMSVPVTRHDEALALAVSAEELLPSLVIEAATPLAREMFLWGCELLREAQSAIMDVMVEGSDATDGFDLLLDAGKMLKSALKLAH